MVGDSSRGSTGRSGTDTASDADERDEVGASGLAAIATPGGRMPKASDAVTMPQATAVLRNGEGAMRTP
jgi:hypothetical protein